MNQNIKTFLSAFYETNKREFWLLIVFNIVLGLIVNLYDFNGLVKACIIILMALKNLSFLRSASVMPSVSSDFDRYSWKYFQGLPLNKEELIISLMISNIFVMFPGLVWLMSFFIQIASLFADNKEKVDYIVQLKIFLCLLPVLLIISSMSLVNLITFPRKQYSKNEPKAVFLHKVKVVAFSATGFLYFLLGCVYFNEVTGIDLAMYFEKTLQFIFKQSTWWLFPALIAMAVVNYYYAISTWQNELKSYLKIDWNPKRDVSALSLCVALIWAPIHSLDLMTPEEFVDGKIVNAIYKGDYKKVKALIEAGHDINEINLYGYNPALTAASKGHLAMFKLLEEKGAKLDGSVNVRKRKQLSSGLSIFNAAIRSGNSQFVSYLLKKGFNANEKNSHNQWSPLHYAAKTCRPEIIDLLIANKAELNVKDKLGRTPLHLAADIGCFGSVALLLDAGANPNVVDNKNKVALNYAEEGKAKYNNRDLRFYLEKRSRAPANK